MLSKEARLDFVNVPAEGNSLTERLPELYTHKVIRQQSGQPSGLCSPVPATSLLVYIDECKDRP